MSEEFTMSQNNNEFQDEYDSIAGIEEDKDEEKIFEPFNPADVDIITKTEVISQLLGRIERSYTRDASASVNLAPDFQRNSGIWKLEKKSQLIESILLGIPLPMFYVSATRTGEWDVVDGIQRLSILRDFLLGEGYIDSVKMEKTDESLKGKGFKLKGLEFLRQFEGKSFKELPNKQQDDIRDCNVLVTIIRSGTPSKVKFNIFKRINTGGMPLTNQEVRHALNQGSAATFLKELVGFPEFNMATTGSISDTRMEGRELILRVLASLLFGHSFPNAKVDIEHTLNEAMYALNIIGGTPEKSKEEIMEYNKYSFEELSLIFKNGMIRSHFLFGKHAFRKSFGLERRTQINKALFETWVVSLGLLAEEDWTTITTRKDSFLDSYNNLRTDARFTSSVGNQSYTSAFIIDRYENIRNIILSTIKG